MSDRWFGQLHQSTAALSSGGNKDALFKEQCSAADAAGAALCAPAPGSSCSSWDTTGYVLLWWLCKWVHSLWQGKPFLSKEQFLSTSVFKNIHTPYKEQNTDHISMLRGSPPHMCLADHAKLLRACSGTFHWYAKEWMVWRTTDSFQKARKDPV